MWYQVVAYLKFLATSTNQHGVHSPFVYSLLTKCLYKKEATSHYQTLESHRKLLKQDSTSITVKDFGKGSKVFTSNNRKVSKLVKHVGISKKRQRLLYKLTQYFQPENSLELGTSIGLATAAMALGYKSGTVTTVEGCPETAAIASKYLLKINCTNVTLHVTTFEDFFKSNSSKNGYQLIYIDGNHTKEATINYFEKILPNVLNDSVIIFDDIYWSKEMTEAWSYIYKHPKVTVSIDTFKWGLVFFRKEQPKQHFKIRL